MWFLESLKTSLLDGNTNQNFPCLAIGDSAHKNLFPLRTTTAFLYKGFLTLI